MTNGLAEGSSQGGLCSPAPTRGAGSSLAHLEHAAGRLDPLPTHHRAPNALANVAILRRRRRPLSMRRPTIGRTFRRRERSVNMAKSRQAAPKATIPEDRQNHDYRHAVPLRTHPTPLVRQQAVERRFGEPKRNRRFRTGTPAAEHDYDRRYSARL
jgi:hypothetical protein